MATRADGGDETRAASVQTLLDSPVRREIVDLLANLPPESGDGGALPGLTASELAAKLGLHVTTIRFHLDRLVAGGLVSSVLRAGQVGRPRKVYRFRPRTTAATGSGQAYRALAELLAESWGSGGAAESVSPEQAGERWVLRHADLLQGDVLPAGTPGAWIGKVGRTVDLLSRWGYTPELRTSDDGRTAELTLLDCPFLPLAETNTDVVCGVHRGLLRGAMKAVGEPDTEVSLHPFVGPGRCLATLTRPHLPHPAELHPAEPDPPSNLDEESTP